MPWTAVLTAPRAPLPGGFPGTACTRAAPVTTGAGT